jgi:hypothetical protein
MTTSRRIRSPDGRFAAIPLGMAIADGMAMVHNLECSDGWFQSLPADNIEPCSCTAFARSVHYVQKEGIKREIDPLLSG